MYKEIFSVNRQIMEENKQQPEDKQAPKAKILREDEGKRTPPTHPNAYVTGGSTHSNRPEQGPEVPPEERTEGIP